MDTKKTQEKKGRKPSKYHAKGNDLAWHPAFLNAMKLELEEYEDVLQYISEYQLSSEPLRMDLLIIKKEKNVVIKKNIAAIFRKDNIVEYKSPSDYLSIKDFYKVCAYAYLYAAQEDDTDLHDITITFIESRHPRKLLSYLKNSLGHKVEETQSGVYTVSGGIVPIQIVNSKKLSRENNIWLKSLNSGIGSVDVWSIEEAAKRTRRKALVEGYLNVVARANRHIVMEAYTMGKRLPSWEEVVVETGLAARWMEEGEVKGEAKGRYKTARTALSKGCSPEFVHDITGLDMETIKTLQLQGETV